MYTAPNGMIFKDYWESIEYGKTVLRKEKEALFVRTGFEKIQCPNCGGEAALREDKFYICERCGMFSLSTYSGEDEEDIEDESEG